MKPINREGGKMTTHSNKSNDAGSAVSERLGISSKILMLLVGTFLVATGIQTCYIGGMSQKINELKADSENMRSSAAVVVPQPQVTPQVTPQPQVPLLPQFVPKVVPPKITPKAPKQSKKMSPLIPYSLDDWWSRPFDASDWDPFREMQEIQDHMNSAFGDSFGRFGRSTRFGNLTDFDHFSPNIDLREEEDQFVVTVDLPGAENKNIAVKLDGQLLTISGAVDKKDELVDNDDSGVMLRRERRSGKFSRTITLPAPVKESGMKTDFDGGVMTVIIPKQ